MDEFKLNLGSKFMKGLVTKIISNTIFKKYGYKVDISIEELSTTIVDGKLKIHVNADAEIDNNEFMKIMKSIKLD